MYTLIVDCSGFPLEHSVYLVDEGGQTQSIAQLPTAEIAGYAVNQNVDTIYLQGSAGYCAGISEAIETQLNLDYSSKKIKVEVL